MFKVQTTSNKRFWITLIISSLTLLVLIFLLWELIEKNFFKHTDYTTLHYLYITRGMAVSLILAGWAVYFIWKEKLRYQQGLNTIIDNSTDAILVYDDSGDIETFNKASIDMFGLSDITSIWDFIPSEKKDEFSQALETVRKGKKLTNYETEKLTHTEDTIPVSTGLTYIKENNRFIETIRNISESIKFRNKLVDIEKSHLFGRMSEGFAHHMGTPLASVLLRVQMLKEEIYEHTQCSSCMEKLDSIEKQISYGKKLLQRLLKFASRPESQRQAESISSLIKDGIEVTRPLLSNSDKIDLDVDVDEEIGVKADRYILVFVFSDLIMNAIDSMPEGGKLTISSQMCDSDTIEINISDTGVGIPDDVLPRVFEPFYTTKPAGIGTGLGLSVSKIVVQDHGGEIDIESMEQKGTTVHIRLPVSTQPVMS